MKLFRSSRKQSRPESGPAGASNDQVPVVGSERLDHGEDVSSLAQLSQVELAAVEAHERSNEQRVVLLNKLRWLRGPVPMPDYDALDEEAVTVALAEADAETVRAVRDYERRHRGRSGVLDTAARVLPNARPSAGEDRAREERVARIAEGHAGRERTAKNAER